MSKRLLTAFVSLLSLAGIAASYADPRPTPVSQSGFTSRTPSLYFLSVGAQDYADDGGHWLGKVGGAVNSASKIADLAQRNGARYGVLLTSRAEHYVTKADIFTALAQIKAKIWSDRPSRPVVLFYYVGHGVGDSSYLNLFLPPGDVVLVGSVSQSARDQEMKSLVWSNDILSSCSL